MFGTFPDLNTKSGLNFKGKYLLLMRRNFNEHVKGGRELLLTQTYDTFYKLNKHIIMALKQSCAL